LMPTKELRIILSLSVDRFFAGKHAHIINYQCLFSDQMEEWSAAEANLFEEAIEKYGKDFNDIRQDFVSTTHHYCLYCCCCLFSYHGKLSKTLLNTITCGRLPIGMFRANVSRRLKLKVDSNRRVYLSDES
jgi:hypothetical protein